MRSIVGGLLKMVHGPDELDVSKDQDQVTQMFD
jgi:hypothetical protein